MGSGAVLGLAAAPDYAFLIYESRFGNYFKVCNLCLYIDVNLILLPLQKIVATFITMSYILFLILC